MGASWESFFVENGFCKIDGCWGPPTPRLRAILLVLAKFGQCPNFEN